MTRRIQYTLAIIAAVAVGTGAIVFGTLEMLCAANEKVSTIIAIGSLLASGGVMAMIAHLAGAFRGLDEDR